MSTASQVLADVNAVITDSHLVYTSGKHGSAYVNKDAVYPHIRKTSALSRMIAIEFANDCVDVVIAPAVGGVILSQWIAYHLSMVLGASDVLGVYAEKETEAVADPEGKGRKCYIETGNFVIKRGSDKLIQGKRVLVAEDVINTGGSVRKTIEAVRQCGGVVVGVGALCNRGGVTMQDLDVPKFVPLMEVTLDAWDEADCPLCERGVPINTEVGKGREYLARKTVR
ncbi:MAG: phosphoribosyltransferase family protein [Candidatus Moraniibacteriota bacterium]